MAKKQTVGTSSRKKSADASAVPEEDVSDARARGKPVSMHPLSFMDALRVMIKTPPPKASAHKKK